MAKHSKTPDYVKISTYLFLEEYEDTTEEKVRGVVFNKFMTLLNHDLKSTKNIDIQLPHCWYRWGDEVVKYYLMPYTKWDHEDLGITTVAWKGHTPEISLEDPTVIEIRKNIKKYIDEYSDDDGWERAIDKLYSMAPYEFQNEYRKLRESLKGAMRGTYIQDYLRKFLTPLFDTAMESFPNEFSTIKKEKNEFEIVFKASVDDEVPIENLRELTESFWFLFCYYLRVDKKCHENISNETLSIWKTSLNWERELYNRSLQDYVFEFNLEKSNKTIDSILKCREKRVKEFDDLLDEFRIADKKMGQR